jgi:hypothetical protein
MLAERYPLTVICEVLDCARSSYYDRPLPSEDRELQQAILSRICGGEKSLSIQATKEEQDHGKGAKDIYCRV